MRVIRLTEQKLRRIISESVKNIMLVENWKNRQQVSRDELIDLLNSADDNNSSNGQWATLTYVTIAPVYKTKRNWRTDDVQGALDKHKDKSEEDWYQRISDYNRPEVKSKNNMLVVVAQRREFHWASEKNFKKAQRSYLNDLSNLRMKYGLGMQSDGKLGDNHNQRQKSDTGAQFNQTGNLSRDVNFAGEKYLGTTAYFVREDGSFIEFPEEVLNTMKAPPKQYKPEKEAIEKLSAEDLEAYVSAKKELDKKFKQKNLLFDRLLCLAANINGQSYYYINDKILQNEGVKIDQSAMVKIAEKQLREVFKDTMDFAH